MLLLWRPGCCWIVLGLTVIGGLLTTADLTELDNADDDANGDNDDDDDGGTMKCNSLGVDALTRVLGSMSKYAAGHMTKKAKSHTLANAIRAEYPSVLSAAVVDEMRNCQSLGKEALTNILMSRIGNTMNRDTTRKVKNKNNKVSGGNKKKGTKSIKKTWTKSIKKTGTKSIKETGTKSIKKTGTKSIKKKGAEANKKKGIKGNKKKGIKGNKKKGIKGNKKKGIKGNKKKGIKGNKKKGIKGSKKKGIKGNKKKWTKASMEKRTCFNENGTIKKTCSHLRDYEEQRSHAFANDINEEHAGNTNSETGRRYEKIYETPLPKDIQKLMKEVPLEEIEEKIRTANSGYDIIRIFLKDNDISDEAIGEMLRSEPQDQGGGAHNLANAFDAEYAGTTSSGGDLSRDLEDAKRHLEEQLSDPLSKCQAPQPKAIYMKQPKQPESILPVCTIVYKCRNDSGCCDHEDECTPTNQTEIRRAFMLVESNEKGQKTRRIVTKTFTEHFECKCRHRSQNCFAKCPSMFRMRRQEADCVCDCDSETNDTTECESIKDGNKGLNDEDLACVTDGSCKKPICREGQFDVSQNKCPKTENI